MTTDLYLYTGRGLFLLSHTFVRHFSKLFMAIISRTNRPNSNKASKAKQSQNYTSMNKG
jgi:hypothetical protein